MKLNLVNFIGKSQMSALRHCLRGEEKEYFLDMIRNLKVKIARMPKTYETDGQGQEAVAHLHYFSGGSDWWIVERDTTPEQEQAFGYVCLNGDTWNAELGYISIRELIKSDIELDLYWKPKTLREIKKGITEHRTMMYEQNELRKGMPSTY